MITPPSALQPKLNPLSMLDADDLIEEEEDDIFGGPTTLDPSQIPHYQKTAPRRFTPSDDLFGGPTTFDNLLAGQASTELDPDSTFIQPSEPQSPLPSLLPPSSDATPQTSAPNSQALLAQLNANATDLNQTPPPAHLPSSSSVPESVDMLLGQQFGNFRIDERIGRGGFGAIYRATQIYLQQPIAIKVLHVNLQQHPQILERFRREAKALARLRHENVVQLSDFGVLPGLGFYLAMEYLEGKSLHRRLKAGETFPTHRVKKVIQQLCQVLGYIHKKQVIHRDMKPSNIILIQDEDRGELLKLIDFGIASLRVETGALTQEGSNLGTAKYMSPEQVQGSPTIDGRSDLYSVGVILYRLLTGELPFSGQSEMEYLQHQVKTPPPSLSQNAPHRKWSPQLEEFLQFSLAKTPNQRPNNAQEFWHHFEKAIDTQIHLEEGRSSGGNALLWLFSFLVLVGLAAATWLFWPFATPSDPNPSTQQQSSNTTPTNRPNPPNTKHSQPLLPQPLTTPSSKQPNPKKSTPTPPKTPATKTPPSKSSKKVETSKKTTPPKKKLSPALQYKKDFRRFLRWKKRFQLHLDDLGPALQKVYTDAKRLRNKKKTKQASEKLSLFLSSLGSLETLPKAVAYAKYVRMWSVYRSFTPKTSKEKAKFAAIQKQMLESYTKFYKTGQYVDMNKAMNKIYRKLRRHPMTSKPL